MKRNIDMKEVSDGRFYGLRDMVKAGCGDCQGCCDCCRDMGSSILLDPYDLFRLTTGLNRSFDQLLDDKIELNGSFCTGQCAKGVCVKIDDELFSVSPETVDSFFDNEVLRRLD